MAQKHFRLVTLGRIALVTPDGEDAELGKRRRKLALLAVLALSRRPLTRPRLAEMFWGDEDEERARHSLSDALSHLRRVLGRDAIGARSETIALDCAGRLSVDALELEAAVESRDWSRAVELHRGEFLPDVYVDHSPSFDEWLTRERGRYERLLIQACEAGTPARARAGDWAGCRALASRWLAAVPRSNDAAHYLLQAGAALPDRAAAQEVLDEYERHAARLVQDFGVRPDPRVEARATQLGQRLAADRLESVVVDALIDTPVPAPVTSPDATPLPVVTPETRPVAEAVRAPASPITSSFGSRRPSTRLFFAVAAAVLLLVGVGVTAMRSHASTLDPIPAVAVTDIQTPDGDTALTWLREGLREMLATDLARASSLTVVAPTTIRDLVSRAGMRGRLDAAQQAELARRVRATWAVSGAVSRADGGYTLDVTVRDAASAAVVQRYAVSGNDVIAVAGQAAAFVLAVAGEHRPGPHLSDIETANVEAFRHFTEGVQLETLGDGAKAMEQYDAAIAADPGFVSAIAARIRGAQATQDRATYARLKPLLDRAGSRVTEWDRMSTAEYAAMHGGEHARAEQLAREIVARFPRDPRAYATLADVYESHGKLASADSVITTLLALDSLAIAAGTGPCVPCGSYGHLIGHSIGLGDLAQAERLARRWTDLQPGIAGPWAMLADVLAYQGRYEPAFAAVHRAQALDPSPGLVSSEARLAIMARQLDRADSIMRRVATDTVGSGAVDALDVHAIVQRERGQPRASIATYARLRSRFGGTMDIVMAHSLGRLGDVSAARRTFEDHKPIFSVVSDIGAMQSDDARAFAWHHALEADAIAEHVDTTVLRMLADSIQHIGAVSYYARDWRLPHHVRGLIAMRAGRYDEAVRELEAARWEAAGWTRTNVELARAHLALGHPDRALAVLRDAYKGPLDAMGRYVPHSELDFWMAQAFQQAGMSDSASVYASYVRRAWANAEPEVKRQLALLH